MQHNLDSVIECLINQIELISRKIVLEENRSKNNNSDKLIEYSTLLLQTTRSLNELLVVVKNLENKNIYEQHYNFLMKNGGNFSESK
jgi:hypothetical protein